MPPQIGGMKTFRVKGKWRTQAGEEQVFTRELQALAKEHALERVYSEIGSRHRVKRNLIHILEITEVGEAGGKADARG